MDKNTKILLFGGLSIIAFVLIYKKVVVNKMTTKKVAFEPSNVEKMPWIAIPNALPEIQVNASGNSRRVAVNKVATSNSKKTKR